VTLSKESIRKIAPAHLDNFRSSRYRAEEQAIRLDVFTPEDQGTVRDLYTFLSALQSAAELDDKTLQTFLTSASLDVLTERVRKLGGDRPLPELAEAVHDLRGGAFGVLSIVVARFRRHLSLGAHTRSSLAIAARDHLKMMRNVLSDLDPELRARDLDFREHSLADLARAFREFPAYVGDKRAELEVDCDIDAVIAESCVECGAIDRIAYNLLNNAIRHADSAKIRVWMLAVEGNLRVAIANAVTPEQRRVLETVDAATLFGGFTTTGSGHGLRIVADLVSRAYGVSVAQLANGHYVGAKLIERDFVTWFHWPLSGA